jgi:hypothetical protein
MNSTIQPVNNSADIRDFHRVLDVVYAKDPVFVHYIENDVEDVFSPEKNKLFNKGWQVQRWVAKKGSEPVGRIAAFCRIVEKDSMGNAIIADKGGIGFFDCVQDDITAAQLFDTAENWLYQKGVGDIQAPINFGDRDSFWGLRIEGTTAPSYRENYHPAYYRQWFLSKGYEVEIEQFTYDIIEEKFNFERFSKIAERVTATGKYTFEFLDYNQLEKFTTDFVTIYNKAWSFHEDFEPLTNEALLKRFKSIKPAMPKEFAVFAYDQGEPIGLFISILELNLLFKSFKGKLGLWQKILFMLQRNSIRKAKGIVFGIIPSHHNLGIETGMIIKFHQGLRALNRVDSMELSWIGDFNPKMISMLQSLGAYKTKTHHTFLKKKSSKY